MPAANKAIQQYQLIENEAGELDLSPLVGNKQPINNVPAQISVNTPDDYCIKPTFYSQKTPNMLLGSAQMATQGLYKEILYITYEDISLEFNPICAKNIVYREATKEDILDFPVEYAEFMSKYNANKQAAETNKIVQFALEQTHSRKENKEAKEAKEAMPVTESYPRFDMQTHMINSKNAPQNSKNALQNNSRRLVENVDGEYDIIVSE